MGMEDMFLSELLSLGGVSGGGGEMKGLGRKLSLITVIRTQSMQLLGIKQVGDPTLSN